MQDQSGDFESTIDALESVARGLTREQIASFAAAVRDAPTLVTWPADERYWYSGTAGLTMTRGEKTALPYLWTRMLAGLAFAVSGEEVEAYVARPTLIGRLDRLLEPRQRIRIEGQATAVIERTLGGEAWRGVIGIWNAFCGALLRERLGPPLRSDLGFAWRSVMGEDVDAG
jgi:hypothetical protein